VSSASVPRRPPALGPEPWSTFAGLGWCHSDLWYCLMAALDHDGDLSGLEAVLAAALPDPLRGGGGAAPAGRSRPCVRKFLRWVSRRKGVPDPFVDLEPPQKPRQERDWLTREEF